MDVYILSCISYKMTPKLLDKVKMLVLKSKGLYLVLLRMNCPLDTSNWRKDTPPSFFS